MSDKTKKIIFLTIAPFVNLRERGIYYDLIREFRDKSHDVTVVCPIERREKLNTSYNATDGIKLLKVLTLNITKSNSLEKGIGLLLLELLYLRAIHRYLKDSEYDLILYSTPPITLNRVISYLKRKYNAKTYLLLKDIFPQNAVDIKLIRNNSFVHKYFRKKEKELYAISDYIGCMSTANLEYLIKNNREIEPEKVEVNPNSIRPVYREISVLLRQQIRELYNIPLEKKIIVYGGNLGKPQGVKILPELIRKTEHMNLFFLIIGSGTEYKMLKHQLKCFSRDDVLLVPSLPLDEYEALVSCAAVGLILLDGRFTVPNFPSRLLTYLEMQVPVLCVTDSVTDIGKILEDAGCGKQSNYNNLNEVSHQLECMLDLEQNNKLKTNTRHLLNTQYLVNKSCDLIIDKIQ